MWYLQLVTQHVQKQNTVTHQKHIQTLQFNTEQSMLH